jgi:hypothetical protein
MGRTLDKVQNRIFAAHGELQPNATKYKTTTPEPDYGCKPIGIRKLISLTLEP